MLRKERTVRSRNPAIPRIFPVWKPKPVKAVRNWIRQILGGVDREVYCAAPHSIIEIACEEIGCAALYRCGKIPVPRSVKRQKPRIESRHVGAQERNASLRLGNG